MKRSDDETVTKSISLLVDAVKNGDSDELNAESEKDLTNVHEKWLEVDETLAIEHTDLGSTDTGEIEMPSESISQSVDTLQKCPLYSWQVGEWPF